MKIDVKEISKITLAENEMLLIQIPKYANTTRHISDTRKNEFKEMFPKEWRDRVLFIIGDVKFTKVKHNEKG